MSHINRVLSPGLPRKYGGKDVISAPSYMDARNCQCCWQRGSQDKEDKGFVTDVSEMNETLSATARHTLTPRIQDKRDLEGEVPVTNESE